MKPSFLSLSLLALFPMALSAAPNHAPTLEAIEPKLAVVGSPLRFTLVGSDSDPESTLIYSATTLPAGASIDANTHDLCWTPTQAQVGTTTVHLSVSDGELTDSKDATITVVAAAEAQLNASVVSCQMPVNMVTDEIFDVQVTMRNTGTVTWGQAQGMGSSGILVARIVA